MLIFLDFDDVIFNTKEFRKDYFNLFKKKGVSKKIFEEFYYDPLDKKKIKIYHPTHHIKRICDKKSLNFEGLKNEVVRFIDDTSGYVFGDVGDFLNKFSSRNLYMISFSKTNFQKTKIFNSGIADFFGRIEITDDSKGAEIYKILKNKKIKKDIFFIDDRVEHIRTVKSRNPQITTILFSRKEGRYRDKKNKYCDYQAKKLKEIKDIINNKISNGKKTKNKQ